MFSDNRCMDMGEMKSPEAKHEFKHTEKGHTMPVMNGMGSECPQMPMPGCVCPPVYECPQERCVTREIVHEVPHIQPVNTRIINHHIYKHSFTPCFTCCEENVCSNVFEGPHCGC